jgi:hypothetical protein
MEKPTARELETVVVPRVLDLRAEFEAQLRAVARVEEQLRKSLAGSDPTRRQLTEVLRRELAEMFVNNSNIRDVLVALAADSKTPVAATGESTPPV